MLGLALVFVSNTCQTNKSFPPLSGPTAGAREFWLMREGAQFLIFVLEVKEGKPLLPLIQT